MKIGKKLFFLSNAKFDKFNKSCHENEIIKKRDNNKIKKPLIKSLKRYIIK